MCGRYDLHESPQMLALYFLLSAEPEAFSNSDVRPANVAPIIRIHVGQRLALPTRWGLIPSWSKDDKIAQHTFSARAETVEKPSFRAAFKWRRCIVHVSAFFEWRAVSCSNAARMTLFRTKRIFHESIKRKDRQLCQDD